MPCLVEREPLAARLGRRLHVEQDAVKSGKSFRRSPTRQLLERLFIKPALKAVLMPTGLYALGVRNALRPVVRKLRLEFRNLPSAFDGYRIVHLSDLHIDGLKDLPGVVNRALSDIKADVCLMTGDYRFDTGGPSAEAWRGMRRVLVNLPYPVYGILGNHDPCDMALALEQMGVTMLINEAMELTRAGQSIWLAGVDDSFDYRCDDLDRALEEIPRDEFKILLSHTPDLYDRAAASGVHLYLCGHTHGGQIRLPGMGAIISNSEAPRSCTLGYWRHGHMHGYTSAGVGSSMLPIRFNCPPEIAVIELRRSHA